MRSRQSTPAAPVPLRAVAAPSAWRAARARVPGAERRFRLERTVCMGPASAPRPPRADRMPVGLPFLCKRYSRCKMRKWVSALLFFSMLLVTYCLTHFSDVFLNSSSAAAPPAWAQSWVRSAVGCAVRCGPGAASLPSAARPPRSAERRCCKEVFLSADLGFSHSFDSDLGLVDRIVKIFTGSESHIF